MTMRKVFPWVLIICFLLIVLLVFWPGDLRKEESMESVPKRLTAHTPGIAASSDSNRPDIPSFPSARTVASMEDPPIPTAIPASTPSPAGVLAVRLVDALGDPIPNGVIEIASRTYRSATSQFLIRDVAERTCAIQARAQGYQSTTDMVQIPTEDWQTIPLEYLCSYEIVVYSDRKQKSPVLGADVFVWEGPPVRRPVGTEAVPSVYLASWEPDQLRLHRDENGIHVVDVDSYQSASRLYDTDPEPGDTVLGVGGLMWRSGDQAKIPPAFPIRP
ncbi:MAG: hypothetical protein ABIH23_18785, partial [bacterium]